jgi:hypothetical protein
MLLVPVIFFFVSLALGLFWKSGTLSLLIITIVIATGFGIYLGNWSFLHPITSVWRNLIYDSITVVGYFVFYIPPALAGAILGNVLRSNFRKK